VHARGSARVQAPDCGAPASRSDFAAGLILLSLFPTGASGGKKPEGFAQTQQKKQVRTRTR